LGIIPLAWPSLAELATRLFGDDQPPFCFGLFIRPKGITHLTVLSGVGFSGSGRKPSWLMSKLAPPSV